MTFYSKTMFCVGIALLGLQVVAQKDANPKIYQYATLNALMEGGYDGDLTMKELQKKGILVWVLLTNLMAKWYGFFYFDFLNSFDLF